MNNTHDEYMASTYGGLSAVSYTDSQRVASRLRSLAALLEGVSKRADALEKIAAHEGGTLIWDGIDGQVIAQAADDGLVSFGGSGGVADPYVLLPNGATIEISVYTGSISVSTPKTEDIGFIISPYTPS